MPTNTKTDDPTAEEMSRLCQLAGITADEISIHPEYGLMVSASGVRKLTRLAPNPARAQAVRDFVADIQRSSFRVVDSKGAVNPQAATERETAAQARLHAKLMAADRKQSKGDDLTQDDLDAIEALAASQSRPHVVRLHVDGGGRRAAVIYCEGTVAKGLVFTLTRHSGRVFAGAVYDARSDFTQANEYATMEEALADIGAALSAFYSAIGG